MATSVRPQIPIVPGENWWRLIRTARDGASAGEIAGMVGPVMVRFLRPTGPQDPWEMYSVDSLACELQGEAGTCPEFRIGNVRPVQVLAVRRSGWPVMPLPSGALLADRQTAEMPTVPTVALPGGGDPWWITLRFWWRGPATTTDYPALRVDWLGVRSWDPNGADWVLDRAVQPAPDAVSPDPGDQTWGSEQATNVQVAGARVLKGGLGLGTGILVGMGLYLLIRRQ